MGDRATCALLFPQHPHATPQPLFVYSHWHGAELPQRVAQGIHDGRNRWGEPSYMAAILVRGVIGDDWPEHDGWGIGLIPYGIPADDGRPLLAVDLVRRRAGFVPWSTAYNTLVEVNLAWDYEAFLGEAWWPATVPRSL